MANASLMNWIVSREGSHTAPAYHKAASAESMTMVDSWIVGMNGPYAIMPFRLVSASETHALVLAIAKDDANKRVNVFICDGIMITRSSIAKHAWSSVCTSKGVTKGILSAIAAMYPGFAQSLSSPGSEAHIPIACKLLASVYGEMIARSVAAFYELCEMMTAHLKIR